MKCVVWSGDVCDLCGYRDVGFQQRGETGTMRVAEWRGLRHIADVQSPAGLCDDDDPAASCRLTGWASDPLPTRLPSLRVVAMLRELGGDFGIERGTR